MIHLDRLKPNPVPAIHPVPEYRADPSLTARYDEMKQVLQVPWMGVVTMAYAHYPNFYAALWQGLRDLCGTQAFVAAFQDLRGFVEARVADLAPPPLAGRLVEAGYAEREIADIRASLEVFSHGNFPYLLIATIVRLLLEGGELGEGEGVMPFSGRHAPAVGVPFVLMESHHADAPTRLVYDDVKRVLGLPFVNTDYRALARWPSYFALAWGDLSRDAGSDRHESLATEIHRRAVEIAQALPNPGRLSGDALRAAACGDAPLGEILNVARLFQWLLPGLVINIAYFRAQLLDR